MWWFTVFNVTVMEHDVPLAEALKRRLKRIREDELEVNRALVIEAKSIGQRHAYKGCRWIYSYGGEYRMFLGSRGTWFVQLCSDVSTRDAR